MNSTVPDGSTATTADPAVAESNPAAVRTDEAPSQRQDGLLLRIAAAVSAAHTAGVPF